MQVVTKQYTLAEISEGQPFSTAGQNHLLGKIKPIPGDAGSHTAIDLSTFENLAIPLTAVVKPEYAVITQAV